MSELRDERDDLRRLADQHEWEIADLRAKLEAAEKALALIGERAVVDWDGTTVGDVDAAVHGNTYQDWLRHVLVEVPAQRDAALAKVAELRDLLGELLPAIPCSDLSDKGDDHG